MSRSILLISILVSELSSRLETIYGVLRRVEDFRDEVE